MGERKVIQKYYPPDFDPSKLVRVKRGKNYQEKVRGMLPMTVQCITCGEFIGKGKKFNVRKETVVGEDYLGIKVFRFYFRCTRCSAEFTLKTDPRNFDYVCETGVTRNFESFKRRDIAAEEKRAKEAQESKEGDAMKMLEQRTKDSKREMDALDALDELRAINAASNNISTDTLWAAHASRFDAGQLDQDDEALVQSIRFRNAPSFVRRLDDDGDGDGGGDDDSNARSSGTDDEVTVGSSSAASGGVKRTAARSSSVGNDDDDDDDDGGGGTGGGTGGSDDELDNTMSLYRQQRDAQHRGSHEDRGLAAVDAAAAPAAASASSSSLSSLVSSSSAARIPAATSAARTAAPALGRLAPPLVRVRAVARSAPAAAPLAPAAASTTCAPAPSLLGGAYGDDSD